MDGFITASVPGEIGTDQHDPEEIHVFGMRDGTCNYYPAADDARPNGEGMRVYAPTDFEYDAQGQAGGFAPAYALMDGIHISRCAEAWWSRSARVNITNALFAWNWVGLTNHYPGYHFCPGTGISTNLGLANHVVDSLFVGYGDHVMNQMMCDAAHIIEQVTEESPGGVRQYDGAFWLSGSRWVNMSTVPCPSPTANTKSLPYALVSGRQLDCNGKYPIHLYDSWPLGASAADSSSEWAWALNSAEDTQNLGQFSGTASCTNGPTGGVVDMTGTLDPERPSAQTAYVAVSGSPPNPGELAGYTAQELEGMAYAVLPATTAARIKSAAWSGTQVPNPDYAHLCGYCFYDEVGCPTGPTWVIDV